MPSDQETTKGGRLVLPEHRVRYRLDEKLRLQVNAARALLSESMGCQMKISELCARPGAGVLRPIFDHVLKDQALDMLTAQQILNVLDDVAQQEGPGRSPRRA